MHEKLCTGRSCTHYWATNDVLLPAWHSLVPRVVEHDVEEDVKTAEHPCNSTVSLNVDEQPAVHELLHCERGDTLKVSFVTAVCCRGSTCSLVVPVWPSFRRTQVWRWC